jgi:predicted adenine nucleotide alpha hydrolase (AANH) superfamily ATPase
MVVHICCAVDSHYFLQRVKYDFPEERIIGFFHDPNIHPYSEYKLRLLEVKRSCQLLGVELIEGEYSFRDWLNIVKGLEDEPEKGKRCSLCFNYRFEESAKVTAQLKESKFTSSLLISPKKSISQLKREGEEVAKKYGVEFITVNYREKSGTQLQNIVTKKDKLYRQDYCGCIYGLKMQREQQSRFADELLSPISGRVEPESIDYRLNLYSKRLELEEDGEKYEIVKERFLNYRLKYALLKIKKKVVVSHILPYSTLKRGYTRGTIQKKVGDLHYLNRDEVVFIPLKTYNEIGNLNYSSIRELIFNPPSFDDEVKIRFKILNNHYSLSAIVVVDEIKNDKKIELKIDSEIYEDVIERLVFK